MHIGDQAEEETQQVATELEQKPKKEAEELVRAAIGFGSVKFYYWEDEDSTRPKVKYKEVVKELPNSRLVDTAYLYEKPRHACEPLTL